MTETPGADELRMRAILRKRHVGPDADPPPEDWWKTSTPEPDEPEQEQPDRPAPFAPQPDYWPRPHLPAAVTRIPDQAATAISPRTRKALYNATAAGAGWGLGLYQQFAGAITDCGQQTSFSGALTLGVGGCLLIAHVWDRRTRHWQPALLAWAARIPLATALLALALWAPTPS